MATALLQLAPTNASNAAFRAWGKGIADQIIAFGWSRTTDTGMIDWTNATAPTSTADYRGYDVFKMGDTLNGTTGSIVLKIQYGGESTSGLNPSIKISVANRTDGGGNLLGNIYNSTKMHVSDAARSSNTYRCPMSGDTNRLQVALWDNGLGSPTETLYFSIERTHDATGADTDEGFIIIVSANNSVSTASSWLTNQIFVPRETLGPIQTLSTNWACIVPFVSSEISTNGIYAGKVGAYPIFPFYGILGNPSANTLVYNNNDLALYSQLTVKSYGANHTFRSVGGWGPARGVGGTITSALSTTQTRILMRFE